MVIEKGNTVEFEYTGSFEDGTVFDESKKHGQPLKVVVGEGKIIPGLEKAITGMVADEEKEIVIPAEEAYGQPNPELKKTVPRNMIPGDQEVKEGMILMMTLPNGQQIPSTIKEVKDEELVVDLNHPLAGKTLVFKIKIVSVN